MKITLLGYMGSGKTTLAQQLAQSLDLPHIDLDQQIEAASGASISETILNRGELWFRKAERAQLERVLQEERFVLSSGGGTPCYYDNMDLINQQSFSVYLQYSVPQLYERLEGQQSERPLIAHLEGAALKEYIAKHLFERAAYYERASYIFRAGGRSLAELNIEISTLLKHE